MVHQRCRLAPEPVDSILNQLGLFTPDDQVTGALQQLLLPLAYLDQALRAVSGDLRWSVLRPLIASMATLALSSGLWVRRVFMGGIPHQKLTMGPLHKNQTTSTSAVPPSSTDQ